MSAPSIKPAKVPQSSQSLLRLLRERYPNDSHVTLTEVRDAAGFSASRSCDALSLGTWPSRGLLLRGFEIKVTRADWLREYRDPSKAESFAPYCDEWYLVVADSSIVQADELPDTWGLLVARGSRLECTKPASKNANPDAIDRGLLVAMMKRTLEQGPTQRALEGAQQQGFERGKASVARDNRSVTDLEAHVAHLEKNIRDFQQASGVDIGSRWSYADGTKIGEAVRLVMNGGDRHIRQQFERMLGDARRLVATLEPLAAPTTKSVVESPAPSEAVPTGEL